MTIQLNRNKVRGIGTHTEKGKKIYITKYYFILLKRTGTYIFKIDIQSFLRVLTLELDIIS